MIKHTHSPNRNDEQRLARQQRKKSSTVKQRKDGTDG